MTEKKVQQINSAELRRLAEERVGENSGIASHLGTAEESQRLIHELQVHQIELEMQNEELRQARDERDKMEALLGRYSDLYDFAPVGYFNLDHSGIIHSVNLTGTGFLGVARSLLTGRSLDLFISNESRPVFHDFLNKLFSSEAKETCEVVFLKEGHAPLFALVEAVVSESKDDCRAIVIDISERKRAEEALRTSEERQRLLSETMLQGVVHQDANGEIIDMNPAAERILGKNREQFIGSSSVQEEHHTIRENGQPFPGLEHPSMVALRTGLPVRGEIMGVFNPKLGDYRWISIDAVPVFPPGETSPYEVYTVFEDITERRRAEEALCNSEQQFRLLIKNLQTAVALVNESGAFVIVNRAFLWMFDLADDSDIKNVNDRDWSQWQVFDEQGALLNVDEHPVRKTALTGKPVRDQLVAVKAPANPELKWMLVSAEPILDAQGHIHRLICTYHDITARKQDEEALRRQSEAALRLSEQEFRSLAEAMPQIVWATRPDGWNIYFNQQWVDYTGMTMEESYGHGWNTPFHPDDKQRAWDAWQRATQLNERYSLECRLRGADGVYRWWLVRGEPMRGANGEILKWFGTCTDIEELKRAETLLHEANAHLEQRVAERSAALRQSEALYRSIGESIDYGVWVCAADGRNTYASESFLNMVGITQEQCSNFGWGDVLHPDDAERTIAAWQECVRTGGKWDIEHRFRGTDGQWHHVLARGVPVRNEQGEIISWAGINLDISRLKQAEESLRETRDYLENLLNYANAPIIVWDSSFRVTRFNHAFERLTGLKDDEVIGKQLDILFPDKSRDESMRLIKNALSGERWETVEIPILHTDGAVRTVLWNSANIHDRDNTKVAATIAQGQDITKRKRAEEALEMANDELARQVVERTRELAEKEVLLKEVHHRVKNNMQVISSLVSLQADGSGDETVREVLKDVTYRVRSMALVHEKLYQSADLARIDFAEYTRSLLGYLWRAHGAAAANVRLTLDLSPVLLPVDTAVPCGLILNELAGNALKHAFQGRSNGEVTVALQNCADGRIRLSVGDNGVGLPRGFDWRETPSLGLRLVQMLSKQIGAEVEVSREEGTRFEVNFSLTG